MKRIAGLVHVLDEFHLENYLTRLTRRLKDSRWDAADELRRIIRQGMKWEFEEASEYILSNWTAARTEAEA